MKRFLKFLIISFIIVGGAFSIFEFSGKYRMNILKNNIGWSIVSKNSKDAVAFDLNEDSDMYIAYVNSIKLLKEDGRESLLIQDENLNIDNLLYYKQILYFTSDNKLYKYDLQNNILEAILDDIPYEGKYLNRNLIIKDSKLLLSIGSATNSGIADKDDNYDERIVPYDKSPINITLNGINYGKDKTGAFMAYGNSSKEGQKIKANNIANASVVEINLDNNKTTLYACGIRNVKGWDLDNENNLVAIVGGMENIGSRPINRDFDYIYKLNKNEWYGWPDFSGGDPINSPRFKGDKVVSLLIANPPNKVVAGPEYQFNNPNIISFLAIDKDGNLLDKNSKIFYNSEENIIKAINEKWISYDLLKLKSESNIKGIKYFSNQIFILDSGIGCIYKLQNNSDFIFSLSKSVWIFILLFLFSLLCLIIIKVNNKKRLCK